MTLISVELPASCPFTFRRLNKSLYLIREHDNYGQFPNIYAKVCTAKSGNYKCIVLSDTGCATNVKNPEFKNPATPFSPEYWNLRTVLELTINPGGLVPYLVITTHCHFDHTMGIGLLPSTDPHSNDQGPPTIVLSSAYDPSFIDPWEHLCKNSMASNFHLHEPHYSIGIWAQDNEHVIYKSPTIPTTISTGFITLHTPGHTPDSLTWYETSSRLICVGDSFYETTSQDTRKIKWGPEPRSPIVFEEQSDLALWWKSLAKTLRFVQDQNARFQEEVNLEKDLQVSARVTICAAHVTTTSPDAEAYLLSIRTFMSRILRDQVPNKSMPDSPFPFHNPWCWDDDLASEPGMNLNRRDKVGFDWMVQAPKRIIDEGRDHIPEDEWLHARQ